MFKFKRRTPMVGLSLMMESDFFQAAQPLFEAGEVEVLEWSFDMGWGVKALPVWVEELLQFYSQRDRLTGHGVSYSLLSAQPGERQIHWLKSLQEECLDYRYRHISEHFGWMAAGDFYQSAPLPMPLTPETLQLGREHLKRLSDTVNAPVGLENLAFAFGLQDVLQQGEFLARLLEPVDGFLVLDLHNLYCQVHNFQQSAEKLLERYPLHRVRELHVSGGSWSVTSKGQQTRTIRRDTHNGTVPEAVFELLTLALKRCPSVEAVIFERIGHTLHTNVDIEGFRRDFLRIKQVVKESV
jgi:uncharacterized protein (UPF0276 family)